QGPDDHRLTPAAPGKPPWREPRGFFILESVPMATDDVYRKTELGLAEVKERKIRLNPRLRTMLILVDGTQTEAQLLEEGAGVGAPADFLDQLMAAGLIERVGHLKDLLR